MPFGSELKPTCSSHSFYAITLRRLFQAACISCGKIKHLKKRPASQRRLAAVKMNRSLSIR